MFVAGANRFDQDRDSTGWRCSRGASSSGTAGAPWPTGTARARATGPVDAGARTAMSTNATSAAATRAIHPPISRAWIKCHKTG